MAQSATLHFSAADRAFADTHRSKTFVRNTATLRRFARRVCEIRECRSLVATESRTRAGFETPSLGAKTRARSWLRRRIFFVHPESAWSPRPWPRCWASASIYRIDRSFRCSAHRLDNQTFRAAARGDSTVRLDHGLLRKFQCPASDETTLGSGGMGFFLRDLERHLEPGGRVFFGLNPTFGGNYYTSELRD